MTGGGRPLIPRAVVWPSAAGRGRWWAWVPEVPGPAGIVGPAAWHDLARAVAGRRRAVAQRTADADRTTTAPEGAARHRRPRTGTPAPSALRAAGRRAEKCGDLLTTPTSTPLPP